ncbi:inositol monophosphatase [bacterium]|nr:inositol monophosphatase [bacterium]
MLIEGIDLKKEVEPIIRAAGKEQLRYFAKARSLVRHEKNGAGFCTKADIESENFLIKELSRVIPGADFFAEESGITGNGEYRWVIDPLDGTTNFAHGLPHFCISVALTHKNIVIFGMIYQPVLDELFWAESGKGAWLNEQKIKVSSPKKLDESFLVVGLPYDVHMGERKDFFNKLCSVVPQAYTFRHMGAVALDLAYVACGRFDGIFFTDLAWWDFAAGDLLIKEAGGQTSEFDGSLITLDSKSYVAGSALTQKALFELLRN